MACLFVLMQEATCEKLEDLHLLEPPVVNESRACGDDQEEGDSSDLSNGEQKAKAESSLKDIPVIRDPSVERLMSTYSTAAQQMKQVIVDAIKSRLDAECGSTDGNLPEEEAIKKLAVLKQVMLPSVQVLFRSTFSCRGVFVVLNPWTVLLNGHN